MQRSLVSSLQCPYCLAGFQIGQVWRTERQTLQFATVRCGCDEFPIVDGILWLHRTWHRRIIDDLAAGQWAAARLRCLTTRGVFAPEKWWMRAGMLELVAKLSAPEMLRQLPPAARDWWCRQLYPPHLLQYHLSRSQWKDSLLAAVAGELLQAQRRRSLWLDLGVGIFTYYAAIQKHRPQVQIISLDYDFFNLWLSAALFPTPGVVVRVCGDAQLCQLVRPDELELVTIIDALHAFRAPRQVVQSLTTGYLKPSSPLFISGIPEHLYLPRDTGLFPIPRPTLRRWFPRPPLILDNEQLSQELHAVGRAKLSAVQLGSRQDCFRYAVLWQGDGQYPSYLSCQFLPPSQRQAATQEWTHSPVTWHNQVY